MFITSFEEQNITYRSCSNLRIHLYTYPAKRKPRKAIVKRGTDSNTVSKDDYKDLSNDKLISSIKEYKAKLKAMEEQLSERLK